LHNGCCIMHNDRAFTFFIFAVLIVRVHHVLLAPCFKLLSFFFHLYLLFYGRSWGTVICKPNIVIFFIQIFKLALPWRGWSEINFICTVTFTDPEQPLFGQGSRMYLLHKPSYGKFSGKISQFSLPWQQGSSDQSLSETIKLDRISCTRKVIADCVLKITNFRCHGNKGLFESNATCRYLLLLLSSYSL